ncbi:MAG: hypothetical protein ACREFN_01650, partial [Acetobacteraceae bacterium]
MPGSSVTERAAMLVEDASARGSRLSLEEAIAGLTAWQTLRAHNVKAVRGQLANLSADQRQLLRTALLMDARATGAIHSAPLRELYELRRPKLSPRVEPRRSSGLDPSDTSESKNIEIFGD